MHPQVTFDEETHTYFMDGVKAPSVTEVIPKQSGFDFVSAERMAQTSQDGKYRHHLIGKFLSGSGAAETPIEKGIERFIKQHPEFGKYIGSEVVLWSKFRYCGTADILFEHAVVDVKRTMGNKRYHALQLAGYYSAAVETDKIIANTNYWILQIADDGSYKAANVYNVHAVPVFLSLVKAWHNPDHAEKAEKALKNYLNQ